MIRRKRKRTAAHTRHMGAIKSTRSYPANGNVNGVMSAKMKLTTTIVRIVTRATVKQLATMVRKLARMSTGVGREDYCIRIRMPHK